MLKYTLAAKDKILGDFRKFSVIFKYLSLIYTIGYFIYVLSTQKGIVWVNIVLSILFVGYTIFEILTYKKQIKSTKKIIKRSYAGIRLALKGFTLGTSLYSIYMAYTIVTPMSIILSTLMIILWIIQVLFEVIVIVLEEEVEFLIAAVHEDIVKPYTKVSNIVCKFTGGEKQEYIQPYPVELDVLEEIVQKKELAKKEAKEAWKAEQKEKRKESNIFRKLFKKKD